MRLNEDLFQRSTATRHHPPTDRKFDRLTWTHTAPMGFTGWSQRDTLTTGHGHCRDNRRGSIREIGAIAGHFARRGYKLHGFGLLLPNRHLSNRSLVSLVDVVLPWRVTAPGWERAGPGLTGAAVGGAGHDRTCRSPPTSGLARGLRPVRSRCKGPPQVGRLRRRSQQAPARRLEDGGRRARSHRRRDRR